MTMADTVGAETDREIVTTRVFDAPRALVFRAWTDPEHLPRWWGPRGFTTTIEAMDARPGGVLQLVMHGPDGREYHNKFHYVEVEEPARIVYRRDGEHGAESATFVSTVTFEEQPGGKTKVTMRMVFPTAEVREHVVAKYGAVEGGRQTLERLAEHLASRGGKALVVTLPSDRSIRLTRGFDAPRALVWEAITRPEHVARWWGPRGSTVTACESDLRPGGAWRVVLTGRDGRDHPFRGEYREVEPPARIVRTFGNAADGFRDAETVETLTLDEHDGRTTLIVTILHASKESRDGQVDAGMERGAGESYDRLAELLATMA